MYIYLSYIVRFGITVVSLHNIDIELIIWCQYYSLIFLSLRIYILNIICVHMICTPPPSIWHAKPEWLVVCRPVHPLLKEFQPIAPPPTDGLMHALFVSCTMVRQAILKAQREHWCLRHHLTWSFYLAFVHNKKTPLWNACASSCLPVYQTTSQQGAGRLPWGCRFIHPWKATGCDEESSSFEGVSTHCHIWLTLSLLFIAVVFSGKSDSFRPLLLTINILQPVHLWRESGLPCITFDSWLVIMLLCINSHLK